MAQRDTFLTERDTAPATTFGILADQVASSGAETTVNRFLSLFYGRKRIFDHPPLDSPLKIFLVSVTSCHASVIV